MAVASRVRTSLFTLDAVDHKCQPTSITLSSSKETVSEEVTTVCDDVVAAVYKFKYKLVIEALQDWEDEEGLTLSLFNGAGDLVPFTWRPAPTGGTWSGTVQLVPADVGGAHGANLSSSVELDIVGTPTLTPLP